MASYRYTIPNDPHGGIVDVEDVVDQHGTPIDYNDTVMFACAKGGNGNMPIVRQGTVIKIYPPRHHGYGYWTHRLAVSSDGRAYQVAVPSNCLVVEKYVP